MDKLTTSNFIINYEPELKDFIEKTVFHAENKRIEFNKLFNCENKDVGILKASFFVNHDKFINYIKSISGGRRPPDWATGCFYNGEIQILVDLKNPERKMHTLSHETLHLYFKKRIYQKHNIDRVNWLDESFAVYLDGNPEDISKEKLAIMVENLAKISDGFDMSILSDYNKVRTDTYDGYDMFNLIGKYIFENNLEQEYLELIRTNREKVVDKGKTILQVAIDYFKKII